MQKQTFSKELKRLSDIIMLHNSQPKISVTYNNTYSLLMNLFIVHSIFYQDGPGLAISICFTHMSAVSWKVCWGPFGVEGLNSMRFAYLSCTWSLIPSKLHRVWSFCRDRIDTVSFHVSACVTFTLFHWPKQVTGQSSDHGERLQSQSMQGHGYMEAIKSCH